MNNMELEGVTCLIWSESLRSGRFQKGSLDHLPEVTGDIRGRPLHTIPMFENKVGRHMYA